MVNKKGAFSTGQLLSLVLGVVVVIVVIIGFTQGWGAFTDFFKFTEIDMEIISQRCNALAGASSAGYCLDKIEIGKDNYVNCEYAQMKMGAVVENPLDCDKKSAQTICQNIELAEGKDYKGEKVKVNGAECCSYFPKDDKKKCPE